MGHHREVDAARESTGKNNPVTKAKGIFESTILQEASESGGSEPELSKIPSRKHIARRSSRRRSSTTAVDVTQPPTPKRVPRRATTTGATPASTGRARKFLALPRNEQKHVATSIPSLGTNEGADLESPPRAPAKTPSAILEVRSDSDSSDSSDSDDNMTSPSADMSRDVPAPVSFTFSEIPFLTISKDIVENAERSSSQLRFADVEASERRLDESQENGVFGEAHSHQEVIIVRRKNGVQDDRTSDEYSQLSLELAQSRIRLRETRMEVDQIELDILMLRERLLILDQRKEANHVSLFA